ncbi:receptor like protein 22-like [Populus nigra]|uniref:receptor like protein 22-like n=1 Tax=Populus nigra TaxID=3691 RepID=UPI002B27B743|nr:receptor like protein 22-like [Populus nigra]
MKIPLCTLFFFMPLLTMLSCINIGLVSGRCHSDQQSLLLQLKNTLVFNESMSTKLVTWNPSTDCCEWIGISCDIGGLDRVIGLDLSNESITGGLDDSSGLFSLQFLQSLSLSFNRFSTALPVGFANLTDLISLNLSNAGFTGQIPIEISKLTRLVSLDLSDFSFLGGPALKLEKPNFATLVQNLTHLTELLLDGVNISAHGNDWCKALSSSLPNLKVLSMSDCYLSGPLDASLAKLQSLSIIRLSGNNLSAPVPEFLANYSKLTALQLSSCQLNGIFPQAIFQVPTLEILDLSYNEFLQGSFPEFHQNLSLQTLLLSNTNFSGTLPQSIGELQKLSRIELAAAGNNFTGRIPNSMANLTQLFYLDLSSNKFTGTLPSFRKSKNLTYVDVSRNQLEGEIPSSHWEGLRSLTYVDLGYNAFSGSIPSSLFAIPSLQKIQLSNNRFGGHIPEFPNVSSSLLDTLDLSSNKLEGPIPSSVFSLAKLNVLELSSNKLNGTVELHWIQKLPSLTTLALSYNNLTVNASGGNSNMSSFPQINKLRLASCDLGMFPDLRNQSKLFHLDLSDNQITGPVPGWVSALGHLQYLNLSRNLLVNLERPLSLPGLSILDLHLNQLQGSIPVPPSFITYVDYSSNNFSSSIPPNIGNYFNFTLFFSLSNNHLTGAIPQSICNSDWLQVLDLSNNSLSRAIPSCLIEKIKTLRVLNLRRNNFDGIIPDKFPRSCELKTLDLSGNNLQGQVPKSLANCTMLEVLDLGNNQINDSFPCLLKNISSFRVLVLRNNTFSGLIECPQIEGTWSRLQIVDLAFNHFRGNLPNICLKTWEGMMEVGNRSLEHIRYDPLKLTNGLYYQDSITVTLKGLELELVKILTVFTSADFSSNNFEGPIPDAIGQFNALYVLNLSHNVLTGQIPSSLGNLSQLESLDLSSNQLSGQIPQQLTSLTFLSVLNLSYNRLVGRIPTGNQFQTFSSDSFEGNQGLCGPPLILACSNPSISASYNTNGSNSGIEIDWNFVSAELGFIFGLGIIVLPLMFCKRWRTWYYTHVNRVIFRIFPQLEKRSKNLGRRAQRNRRRQ